MSTALEIAKKLTREELFAKAEGLLEYGADKEPVTNRWRRIIEERKFLDRPLHVIAALNNSDLNHALLSVLKDDPDKVFEGLSIAAVAVDSEKKYLYIPEGEETLAEKLAPKAAEYDTEIRTGIVDVRFSRGCLYHHFETLTALVEIMEGDQINATLMAICKDGRTGGLIRVKYGTKLADFIASAGESTDDVRAIAIGNHLYTNEEALELVINADTPIENGVVTLFPAACCMVHEADQNLAAYKKVSCGKCTFCREGLVQLKEKTEEITGGQGPKDVLALMKEIAEAMPFSVQCTLGETAAEFTLGTMQLFAEEYNEHIQKKKCANNVCSSFSTMYIDPNECQGCEDCIDVCPAEAIEGKKGFIHIIDEYECTKCGKCIDACEYEAIIMSTGRVPKLPNRLVKVGKFRKH